MLGCLFWRKKEPKKMRAAFEKAVRAGKKDSLAWTVYAYCLRESGQKEEAIKVLERGAKALKKPDHRLQTNLERLRDGKPLKTAPYGEQWLQFRLDKAPPPIGKGPRGPQLDPNHPALRGLRGRRARHMEGVLAGAEMPHALGSAHARRRRLRRVARARRMHDPRSMGAAYLLLLTVFGSDPNQGPKLLATPPPEAAQCTRPGTVCFFSGGAATARSAVGSVTTLSR